MPYMQYEETIDHLTSRSPTLAPNEYLNRYNTSTGKFVNNMEPNMLKTVMDISQKPSKNWCYHFTRLKHTNRRKIKENKPDNY